MKKVIIFVSLLFAVQLFAQERLMISEVADPSDVYQARFVELYNGTGSLIDFSSETWYLSRQANGGTWGNIQITGSLAAGSLYRIAYNQTDFENAYGFSPELVSGFISGNGDDGYFLYKNGDQTSGTLVDAYGVIDVDGSGEAWEYLDGHAERNAGVSQANSTWTASEWTITRPAATTDMNPNDTSLPVELTSFTANASDSKVTLRWSTASEVNNQGFAILRSNDKESAYNEIDSYVNNSDLNGAGNSSQAIQYTWVDNSVINGNTYWYKLIDVDVDGIRTEHGPISATPNAVDVPTVQRVPNAFYLKNYPNPFNPGTEITFDLSAYEATDIDVELTIYNALGEKVITLYQGSVSNSAHHFNWNGRDVNGNSVPTGIYIYTLKSEKRVESNKMLLLR